MTLISGNLAVQRNKSLFGCLNVSPAFHHCRKIFFEESNEAFKLYFLLTQTE